MKRFIGLALLIGLAGLALADIPPERKLPQQPPVLEYQEIDVNPNPYTKPIIPRWYFSPGVDLPADPPAYDEPQALDEMPNIFRNDYPVSLNGMPPGGLRDVPIIMPPVIRDRIAIEFAPGYGRLYGTIRVYDTGGRLVVSEPVEADGGLSIPVPQLAAGSYMVEFDCGPGLYLKGKMVKLD